jgi:hypothetical protein
MLSNKALPLPSQKIGTLTKRLFYLEMSQFQVELPLFHLIMPLFQVAERLRHLEKPPFQVEMPLFQVTMSQFQVLISLNVPPASRCQTAASMARGPDTFHSSIST